MLEVVAVRLSRVVDPMATAEVAWRFDVFTGDPHCPEEPELLVVDLGNSTSVAS